MNAVGMEIINFICIAIDNGNYVSIYLDEYYLLYRLFYNDWHYTHESLLYYPFSFGGNDVVESVLTRGMTSTALRK